MGEGAVQPPDTPQWRPLMYAGPHMNLPLATIAEIVGHPTLGPCILVHVETPFGSFAIPFNVQHAKDHVAMMQEQIATAEQMSGKLSIVKELPPHMKQAPPNGGPKRSPGWGN